MFTTSVKIALIVYVKGLYALPFSTDRAKLVYAYVKKFVKMYK